MIEAANALWATLPTPALLVDPQDRIVHANPAAESFFVASMRLIEGRSLWGALSFDAPIEDALARAREKNAPLFVNDAEVGANDRAPMRCNIQAAPMAGAPGYMLVLISPLDMAGRNAARSSAKSAIGMAEMLAHEVKNPLAGITGAAQLLSMNLSAEDQELTELIVSECRRIVALLNQVEQFGDVTAPELKAVNIHDVLDRAKRSAMVGFAAHMEIDEDYDPSLPLAHADADQLLQVILNLLKNAAEAAGSKCGKITLRSYYQHSMRVRRDGDEGRPLPLQIEVVDDGPGLPEGIAGDIFDPFVSGRENGTGLGLALAAKIISDHEGWISVNSVPGKTVFRVSLPLAPKGMEEEG